MKEVNYNIEKWKEIGLLDGIPENRHENAVRILNTTINYLINIQQPNEQYETAPMGVIYGILQIVDITEKQTIGIIDEFKKTKIHELENVFSFFDAEALICEYVEVMLKKLKNK